MQRADFGRVITANQQIAMSKKKKKEKDEEKKPAKAVKAPAADAAVKPKPKSKAAAKPVKKKETGSKVITTDDIALRAYFIAERRQAAGGHGDEHADWVEAERQLRKEAGKK